MQNDERTLYTYVNRGCRVPMTPDGIDNRFLDRGSTLHPMCRARRSVRGGDRDVYRWTAAREMPHRGVVVRARRRGDHRRRNDGSGMMNKPFIHDSAFVVPPSSFRIHHSSSCRSPRRLPFIARARAFSIISAGTGSCCAIPKRSSEGAKSRSARAATSGGLRFGTVIS